MHENIPGGRAAFEAFNELFDRLKNHSAERFAKELRPFVAAWGWEKIFPPDQKRLFLNRATGYCSAVLGIEYAAARWAQIEHAGHSFILLFAGSGLDCHDAHGQFDGLSLKGDHRFWQSKRPPFSWGCSCYLIGAATLSGVEKRGGRPDRTLPDDWEASWPFGSVHAATREDAIAAVIGGEFDLA